jgi:DNA-binding XRE family transcriptional regulator
MQPRKTAPRNKTFDEVLSGFSRERRRKIEARAAELIQEELTLRELRRLLKKTQASMAESTGVRQESISRIESRADLKVSTLRMLIEALAALSLSWPTFLISGRSFCQESLRQSRSVDLRERTRIRAPARMCV